MKTIRWLLILGIAAGFSGAVAFAEAEPESTPPRRGGAQLWAQNCAKCHNVRSPSAYSDREWDIAVHHMRVRANLTKEEYEAIREFLKSGN